MGRLLCDMGRIPVRLDAQDLQAFFETDVLKLRGGDISVNDLARKKLSGDVVYQHALKPETTYGTHGDADATRYPARLRTAKPRSISSIPSLGSQLAQRR
jgi:hypothetical protein